MVHYIKWVNTYHHFKNQSFLLLCVYAQSYLTLCNPMGCSLPGSSVHGLLQARILEWVTIPYSRGSSWPRDRACISYISCISRQNFLPLTGKPISFIIRSLCDREHSILVLLQANFCSKLTLKADPFSCTKETKLTSNKQNKIELGCCLFFLSGQDTD